MFFNVDFYLKFKLQSINLSALFVPIGKFDYSENESASFQNKHKNEADSLEVQQLQK